MSSITVYEAEDEEGKIEFIVVDGEPHIWGAGKLNGLDMVTALTDGAVVQVGKGQKSRPFIKLAWLAELFSDSAQRAQVMRFRDRLLESVAKESLSQECSE